MELNNAQRARLSQAIFGRRMNGVFPPVGTIVGAAPGDLAMVVNSVDERGVELRAVTPEDYRLLTQIESPNSVYEHEFLFRRAKQTSRV